MGGLIACEMAQQLQAQGEEVALLALFDSTAPEKKARRHSKITETSILMTFARDMGLALDREEIDWTKLRALDPEEQLMFVLDQAKKADKAPKELEISDLRRFYNIFKANALASQNYELRTKLKNITLFKASEQLANGDRPKPVSDIGKRDPRLVRDFYDLAKNRIRGLRDRVLEVKIGRLVLFRRNGNEDTPQEAFQKWSELAVGGVEMKMIPGNHFTIVREPHVKILAEQLMTTLEEAQKESTTGVDYQ